MHVRDTPGLGDRRRWPQAWRCERQGRRDDGSGRVTSGAGSGTSGSRRSRAIAYAIIVAATAVIGTVNVLSLLDERSWMEMPIDWWRPTIWESSSGIVLVAMAWIPAEALRRFPPVGPQLVRNIAIHLAISIPFSLVHVALMVALRKAAYALLGHAYTFGGGTGALFYEYRKDVITYVLFALIFWFAARLTAPPATAAAAADDATIVIDEGQRLLRVAPAEILAARSSGNYVEYLLADGRRPLMRATLASIEAELGGKGFVRTHRSWLVNCRHVAAIEAEGSGDYGLTLGDGTHVPLSRRYRGALDALRGG